MTYRVILQPRAYADLDEAYVYLAKHYSPKTAALWYCGMIEAIESLSKNPSRCGAVRGASKLNDDVRQLVYRRYRNVHRVLFTIREDTAEHNHGYFQPLQLASQRARVWRTGELGQETGQRQSGRRGGESPGAKHHRTKRSTVRRLVL